MAEGVQFSSSFEEAWRRFLEGAPLVAIDEQRERFLRGRAQFLAVQVPIGEFALSEEISALQSDLADIDGLSLTPEELLHISIAGVGFQVIAKSPHNEDDVLRQEVAAIGQRAAEALRSATALDVTIGPVNVFPDALILEVNPIQPMRDLRTRLAAIVQRDAFPYPADAYLPHVTIGTFLTPDVAGPLRSRLLSMRDGGGALAARLDRIDFVRWWFTGDDAASWPELDTIRSFRLR